MIYFDTVANLIHDVWRGIAPSPLRNVFTRSSEIHRYNTRHTTEGNYYQKEAKLEIYKRLFSRSGAKVWNVIPSDWRDASKSVFRKEMADFY